MLVHRNRPAAPEPCRKTIAPSREDVVVGVECLFTWYWLADLGAPEGVPFVLGHALDMTAIHGGKATNDTIASQQIAVRLRGGLLPQAYVDPAAMRAPRDLLRRRLHLARQRAKLLAHVQHPHSQDHLPAIGHKMADKATRDEVAERCADPAGPKRIAVDLARITSDDALLGEVERTILNPATHHDAHTLYLLHTVPGIGKRLSLVWRYAMHEIHRFPTGQEFVSYCRLVNCAKESVGKRLGGAGKKLENGHLPWAFSDAAGLCLRDHPPAPKDLARLEKTHDTGKALTALAHQLARAVYDLLQRHVAFAKEPCFQHSWRGVDEPGTSLDTQGMHLSDALETAASRASLNAQARRGRQTRSPAR
jgi:transposase